MTERRIIRAHTGDRGPPEGSPEILTVEQIGPKQALTPNGNLICYDVPIARVGWMLYRDGETPIQADPSTGIARVYRGPEDLFNPQTIGSFMGVAVVDEHPEDGDVNPANWKELSHGFTTTNVRRGEGEEADVLLADLVITNRELIEAVKAGKREVSCGYDADYDQTGPGEGRQTNIIGNHVALVERGRCGPRCAIGDHDSLSPSTKKGTAMKRVRLTQDAQARLRKIVKDAEGLLEETADPQGEEAGTGEEMGGTHIHIHTGAGMEGGEPSMPKTTSTDEGEGGDPMEARVSALEAGVAACQESLAKIMEMLGGGQSTDSDPGMVSEGTKMPDEATKDGEDYDEDDETKDEMPDELKEALKAKTGDSAALAQSYASLLADAEILVPGFRAPTFDSKAKRAATIDRMCNIRRKVLDSCYSTVAGKELLDNISGSKSLDLTAMPCNAIAPLFRSAAGAKRLLNNRAATGDASTTPRTAAPAPGAQNIASLNQAMRDFWAKQGIVN